MKKSCNGCKAFNILAHSDSTMKVCNLNMNPDLVLDESINGSPLHVVVYRPKPYLKCPKPRTVKEYVAIKLNGGY